ncbi:hypothetical protein [Mesorhizobium sp. M0130]|uniref:hypothetical protein n=1 Tax=Mesorhizobium sp. M0130 TaxID=2956887 RepID=UPI00333B6D02
MMPNICTRCWPPKAATRLETRLADLNQRIVDTLVRAFEDNENCMDANRYTNMDDLRHQRSSVCAASHDQASLPSVLKKLTNTTS